MRIPEKIDPQTEELWRNYLVNGDPTQDRIKRFFRLLPQNPRCKLCSVPFSGIGGAVAGLVLNRRPSPHNPKICNVCENFARKHPGGAEINLTMLFADVRGSTTLAEGMPSAEYHRLINRFYNTSVDVLVNHLAVIDRLAGDQMIGYFVPGIAGPEYTRAAITAAGELLRATGHGQPDGPWIPVGVGVHRGTAFFGVVGEKDGVIDITALGDAVNIAARLASEAGPGEILLSEDAYQQAGSDLGNPEQRSLTLKGRSEPVPVRLLSGGPTLVKVGR